MFTQLAYVNIIVRDYDEALEWYTRCFRWEKRLDMGQGLQRWLTLGIPGQASPEIILQIPARFEGADRERKEKQIGQNPTWILETSNYHAAFEHFKKEKVKIVRPPEQARMGYATLVEDLYGNVYTVLQRH